METLKCQKTLMWLQANCAISALAKPYCQYFNGDLLQSIFLPCVSSKIGALLWRVRLSITDWICQGKIVFSLGKMQSLLLGRGCHHENALLALIPLLREVVINPARFLVSNGIMFFAFPPQWWANLQYRLHPYFYRSGVATKIFVIWYLSFWFWGFLMKNLH